MKKYCGNHAPTYCDRSVLFILAVGPSQFHEARMPLFDRVARDGI
jgi:hypothetical protein